MKKLSYLMLLAAVGFGLTACDEKQDVYELDMLDGIEMVVRSTSIGEGTSVRSLDSINVDFNNLIGIDNSKTPTLNGTKVEPYVNPLNGMQLIVPVSVEPNTDYVLDLPEGYIYRRDDKSVTHKGLTLSFTTKLGDTDKIDLTLTNPNATAEAKALYAELLANYGQVMYSGAMGGVAWETGYTDYIAANNAGAGYPKVVGFDYIHLAQSPANWIDYGNISPVLNVWNAGSIPTMNWHWNVPNEISNVLSNTTTAMPSDWSGNVQIPAASFRFAKVGTVVTINISDVKSGAQGSIKDGSWKGFVDEDGTSLEYFDLVEGNVNPNVVVTPSTIVFTISEKLLPEVLSGGIILSGHDYTVDSVTFDNIVYDINNLSYNTRNFSVTAALTPGTNENAVINADIEKLAGYLKLLQDAKVPVLFRPLHEAAGDYSWGAWFWWGYEGVDATKQLWAYLRDKLENEYGINNLIWVWTMQTSDAGKPAEIEVIRNAYPGDDLVDIVGVDLYPDNAMTDQTDQYQLIFKVIEGKKMIALSEVGNLVDPQAAAENNALWSYFMNWYDQAGSSFGFSTWNTESVTVNGITYDNPWAAVANSSFVVNQ